MAVDRASAVRRARFRCRLSRQTIGFAGLGILPTEENQDVYAVPDFLFACYSQADFQERIHGGPRLNGVVFSGGVY
jgi:hypothetical protein